MIKKIEKNLIIGSVQFTKKYGFNKKKVPLNEIKKARDKFYKGPQNQ